jgi:UV DNA damage endonuclease
MINRLGYACLNQTLSTEKISVNRGMIQRTFREKGVAYASELIIQNLQDLIKVLNWNHQHGINFYRLSSNMFPWMSEYEIEELPNFNKISNLLKGIGTLAQKYNQRLTFHPGPFNVLASANQSVVIKTIKELNQHAELMDLMNLPKNPFSKINIHVGTTRQGEKVEAMAAFCEAFGNLKPSTKARITVENDDKAGMYTIQDLYNGIHQRIGIPLVFDFHHHFCNPGDYSQEESLKLAVSTWPEGVVPVVHYSEPKSETDKRYIRAHADMVVHAIPLYGQTVDVMLEAKSKECALINFRDLDMSNSLKPSLFTNINEA